MNQIDEAGGEKRKKERKKKGNEGVRKTSSHLRLPQAMVIEVTYDLRRAGEGVSPLYPPISYFLLLFFCLFVCFL